MSAFGYFGSKRRIAAKLCSQLPPHNAWVELFCGSAAMTFSKKPAPIEIINDINGDIVNFFRRLRDKNKELLELIRLTPYAREEFHLARIREKKITDLEKARRFYVEAMMAINGSFGIDAGGFSISNSYSRNGMEARVSRWHGVAKNLEIIIERLKQIRIENKDAMVLFEEFKNRPGTLVYFDPPYLGERSRGYDYDQNTEEYHKLLLKSVIKAKCMIIISSYHNTLYNKFLTAQRGWQKRIIKATTKGNNGKCFTRREVIWFNQPYLKATKRKRPLLRLSNMEKRNKKLNPERKV